MVKSYSAILKKVRIKHLSLADAKRFLLVLGNDFKRFSFVKLDISILTNSQKLIVDYGVKGLRSLDAIQLASALSIKTSLDLILTGDHILKRIFIEEGFNCDF